MGLELSVAYREDGPCEGGADAKKTCLACTWPGVASPRVAAEQVMGGNDSRGVIGITEGGHLLCSGMVNRSCEKPEAGEERRKV